MNIVTGLQMISREGEFEVHVEKGANKSFGYNSLSEIKLNKKYELKRLEDGLFRIREGNLKGIEELSGEIIRISQTELELKDKNNSYQIPYKTISKIIIKSAQSD